MDKLRIKTEDKGRHGQAVRQAIDIPWIGSVGIERRLRWSKGRTTLEECLHPVNIMPSLQSPPVRFDGSKIDGWEMKSPRDILYIERLVVYFLGKRFGRDLMHHASFRIYIGDQPALNAALGRVEWSVGYGEVDIGAPVPVPPRQPLEVYLEFRRNTHETLINVLDSLEDGEPFAFGLKMIGFIRKELIQEL
jgi:hypothetical protein